MPGTPASSARSTCRPRRFFGSTRPASTPSRRPRPGSAAPSVIKLIAILTWVHNLRPRAGALKCFGELYLFSNCDHLWLCTNKPTHFKALKGFEQVEFKLSFWAVEPWWSTQLTLKFKTVLIWSQFWTGVIPGILQARQQIPLWRGLEVLVLLRRLQGLLPQRGCAQQPRFSGKSWCCSFWAWMLFTNAA